MTFYQRLKPFRFIRWRCQYMLNGQEKAKKSRCKTQTTVGNSASVVKAISQSIAPLVKKWGIGGRLGKGFSSLKYVARAYYVLTGENLRLLLKF